MSCEVTYREIEFPQAKWEIVGVERAVENLHPPGFNGTLRKHMGATGNRIRVSGLMPASTAADLKTKITTRMALSDEETGTLVCPLDDGSVSLSFSKTTVSSPFRAFNLKGTPSGPVVEYEIEFLQLIPDTEL